MIFVYFKAPISVYGEGSYAISAVKEIKVTDEFLGLDEDVRKCQNKEALENCTARQYRNTVLEQCQCIPFALKKLSTDALVGLKYSSKRHNHSLSDPNLQLKRHYLRTECEN